MMDELHAMLASLADSLFLGSLPAAAPFKWVALPGEVLLLEGHEIEIRLQHNPRQHAYVLIDSDGREVAATGAGLFDELKLFGQRIAAERLQFVATARGIPRL